MKTTKIRIKNLFGITEKELDGRSVELTGANGTGKTSVIDAIRYALTNSSERDYIIRQGEDEGEIVVETDTGLYINRKKRNGMSDYKSIKENRREIQGPESFLQTLFTPLQLDPVAFCEMPKNEQNRIILDLIEFDWDLNWIREQFGEIPTGVNYEQNILQVLNDIQSENGDYFQRRQDVNRDLRNKRAFIEDIAKDIPANYDADHWESADVGTLYKQIEKIKDINGKIQRARLFRDSYDNKIRGYEAERQIAKSSAEKETATERTSLNKKIDQLRAEIKACETKLETLDGKLTDKCALIDSQYETKVAKLDGDMQTANEYADLEITDCTALEAEVAEVEKMKLHLNEYRRMRTMQSEADILKEESDELTRKIELARTLPGQILQTATIPVKGLTVKDGIPLINGLPVSNLSDGEKLALCVDVALSRPNSLQIILIDGIEKLSEKNRVALYAKCKEKGLQFIASRTTDSEEMEINYL
jgi:hypothetical protein